MGDRIRRALSTCSTVTPLSPRWRIRPCSRSRTSAAAPVSMWSTPSSTARRSTASAASSSAGGPQIIGAGSCTAP
ncbi:hypothetical protein [Nonomuraea sp. NPDC049684]|uniref:hypothetical protein n=1 Tax=Nonomuraea sp. NPDC049684 TaxID=3364356 RepID=UPI0037BD7575